MDADDAEYSSREFGIVAEVGQSLELRQRSDQSRHCILVSPLAQANFQNLYTHQYPISQSLN